MTDWEDRLLDRALRETLGGEAPADLSHRILLRLRGGPRGEEKAPRRPPSSRLRAALLAAVFLCVGLLLRGVLAPRETLLAIRLAVTEGRVRWLGTTRRLVLEAGGSALVRPKPGDRLEAGTARPAVLILGGYRRFFLDPNTILEVRAMTATNRNGRTILGGLAIAVVSGGLGWMAGGGLQRAEAGEELDMRVETAGDGAPLLGTPKETELAERLAAAREEIRRLRARLVAREKAEAPEGVEEEAPAEKPPPDSGDPIEVLPSDPSLAALLARIDWRMAGRTMKEMIPLLEKLNEALEKGGEIPLDLAGEIQKLNGNLLSQAKAFLEAGVPGSGVNGAWTHPAVTANFMNALLAEAGMSLDEGQREALSRLGRRYASENEILRDRGKDPNALALDSLLKEVELKDRFLEETEAMLSADQRRILHPESLRGRIGMDLFSSGLVLAQYLRPVPVRNPGQLADSLRSSLAGSLELSGPARAKVDRLVREFADSLPEEIWKGGPKGKAPLRKAWVQAVARRQLGLMKRILREVPMADADRRQLRSSMRIFLPIRR